MRSCPCRSHRPAWLLAAVATLMLLLPPTDAHALGAAVGGLGGIDSKQRLWLAAFGGLSLGLALGLILWELRSRNLAVAVRRLIDLAIGLDGRFPEETKRGAAQAELARLSDEILYTAQKQGRERREATEQLTAWESRFAAALDALFVLDGAGRITAINPAAERLFKVKADETLGKALSDVMLPPAHRSPDNAAFASDLATGKAQGRCQELVAQRSDGRQFPVEVSIGEFGTGEQRGHIAIARDISLVRRARAELSRLREQSVAENARLREELETLKRERRAAAAPVPAGGPRRPELALHLRSKSPPFTIEATCGEALRKLAARAERRGLGFRYEDGEVHGLALIGDGARLRRVLINLIDSMIRVAERGELIVHLSSVASEDNRVDLAVNVMATGMTGEQAARMVKPFVSQHLAARREAPVHRGRDRDERQIDFLGTQVTLACGAATGVRFSFCLRFEADLTDVAFDLTALPAAAPAKVAPQAAGGDGARLQLEFARSAARLRKNADKANLIALWAEAHRLNGTWQRHGGRDAIGLVSALSHTARGGDATNAVLLARRLADALDAAAQASARTQAVA
jgi:PAS domain S-box-containing protein